ncbi:hypothetical protein M758_8G115800 [Ceratodon purpureus]|nr:hypothetical protein M758_8G115800 [Ceratodon purpureus]
MLESLSSDFLPYWCWLLALQQRILERSIAGNHSCELGFRNVILLNLVNMFVHVKRRLFNLCYHNRRSLSLISFSCAVYQCTMCFLIMPDSVVLLPYHYQVARGFSVSFIHICQLSFSEVLARNISPNKKLLWKGEFIRSTACLFDFSTVSDCAALFSSSARATWNFSCGPHASKGV